MIFLALFAIPFIIAFANFLFSQSIKRQQENERSTWHFRSYVPHITWKEFVAHLVICAIVAGLSAFISVKAKVADTEVWNGYVTNKAKVAVRCSHSYSCDCRQVSYTYSCGDSNHRRTCRGTRTECDTCYEHYLGSRKIAGNDYDWRVYTSINETYNIARIDRQGVGQPPRWTAVYNGEPISVTKGYDNYIKGSPDSLLRHKGIAEKYKGKIVPYPQKVYDYYRLDRFVAYGVNVTDAKYWNENLAHLNAKFGSAKQVNIIVVVVKNKPEEYFYAVQQEWIGGKKNDAILFINLDSEDKITWANVMAWTKDPMFQVSLRDDVLAIGTLDRAGIMTALTNNVVQYYKRKPMKDFEYLKASIMPTPLAFGIALALNIIICIGLSIFFHKN